MHEVTRVYLENEMDVILTHRRSLRLAELAGLSLSAQTAFATAVSEVSRSTVEHSTSGQLILAIELGTQEQDKYIVAIVKAIDPTDHRRQTEGYLNAQKLVDRISVEQREAESNIELRFRIPGASRFGAAELQHCIRIFEEDLPASPYDEIKRKNRQLFDLAEKLRQSETQYRTLTESLPLLIFTWSDAAGLTYINKWTEQYTGQSMEQLSETRWTNVFHPDDYKTSIAQWAACKEAGKGTTGQMRLRNATTGEYLWHMSMIFPQHDDGGRIKNWVGICVDIHAQKLVEQTLQDNRDLTAIRDALEANQAELQQKIMELNHSNEELERFAYVASHDLQEPLRKIIFYSDYLRKNYGEVYDETGKMFFENIIKATGRMQQLVRDILSYSEVGRQRPGEHLVDLNDLIDVSLRDLELLIQEKRAAVHVAQLPGVKGNAQQLKQLFDNLISNSLKYTRKDADPVIDISLQGIEQGAAVIRVSDNGIGFDNQYLSKMFSAFQRLHSRQEFDGTGIGLAICKRVAEGHGGSIDGHGIVGEGASFTVRLPLYA